MKQSLFLVVLLGSAVLGAALLVGADPKSPPADPPSEKPQTPSVKVVVRPPPTDVNDLSMEVAALRTLYLFKAGPDQRANKYNDIMFKAKGCAQMPRERQAAVVSKNYLKVLTELRAAFIAGQEDRINELSEQLEELGSQESPDLDDEVELTVEARKQGPQLLERFGPGVIASYIAAYGKDFPEPWEMLSKTMRLDGKGAKPSPEEWKRTRDFVVREVSWQFGGLDLNQQRKVAEAATKLLDKAYALSNEELKKKRTELKGGIKLLAFRSEPIQVIRHVLEQDMAELLSNPRLPAAIASRVEYLKMVKDPRLEEMD